MKNIIIFFLMCFNFFSCFSQIKVILDTDTGYDPDDAGCMAMLHSMANLGECEILAMINSTEFKESPLTISAINVFYNRKSIPVGDFKGYTSKINASKDTYHYQIAHNFPRNMDNWKESLDGVALYREILESAEPKSITIVIIGTMHNFYGLLNSKPDILSDKSGIELVEKKVKQVVTMGGNFIEGKGLDRTNWGGAVDLCDYTEWSCLNKQRNQMCRYVIENCPTTFMASGWEVGCGDYYNAKYGNVITGQGLKKLGSNHIIRKCYEYHFKSRGGEEKISRHSNDQCALHYAIRGEGDNYKAYKNGKIELSEKGECYWNSTVKNKQGYIQKNRNKDLIANEIEGLMMGLVLEEDTSPPTPPENLTFLKTKKGFLLTWEASKETTKGSWVIGYHIYRNDKLIKTTYGTKYIFPEKVKKSEKIEVKGININGIEGEGVILKM